MDWVGLIVDSMSDFGISPSAAAKLLYLVARAQGGYVKTSLAELGEGWGQTAEAARRSLLQLEAVGWAEVRRECGMVVGVDLGRIWRLYGGGGMIVSHKAGKGSEVFALYQRMVSLTGGRGPVFAKDRAIIMRVFKQLLGGGFSASEIEQALETAKHAGRLWDIHAFARDVPRLVNAVQQMAESALPVDEARALRTTRGMGGLPGVPSIPGVSERRVPG